MEERTKQFSADLLSVLYKLPRDQRFNNLVNQATRAGTSIGANYREANDALGTKDFFMRAKIARKEAKECQYWLELLLSQHPKYTNTLLSLVDECNQLRKILSTIIFNAKKNSDK